MSAVSRSSASGLIRNEVACRGIVFNPAAEAWFCASPPPTLVG
jgi:hypothetical protein